MAIRKGSFFVAPTPKGEFYKESFIFDLFYENQLCDYLASSSITINFCCVTHFNVQIFIQQLINIKPLTQSEWL